MKQRWIGVVALALVISAGATGCSFFQRIGSGIGGIFGQNRANDYGEMHLRLERAAVRYDEALHEIVDETNTRRAGVITEPQWRLFAAGVENVRTANASVKEDMDKWGETGVRPPTLDAHVDALLKSYDTVVSLVRLVKP